MKKIILSSFLVLGLLISSCKQDKQTTTDSPVQGVSSTPDPDNGVVPNKTADQTPDAQLSIPDPCKLITPEELKNIFKIGADVTYNSGSEGANYDKSCFFRIEDKKSNGAILVQISTNPMPAEIDDYPVKMIQGKMEQGEQNPSDGKSAIFASLPEIGDMGCYNYTLGKYHWQYNKDYLFLIAFNTSHSETDQKSLAVAVAKIINKNFQSSINSK
jgi:hypothetical protein